MKKLFATFVLAIVIAGTCLADCPDPNGGQSSGPPCTGANYDPNSFESSVTAGIDAAADDTSLNAVGCDLFIDAARDVLLAVW
jgi:hypothetical protein